MNQEIILINWICIILMLIGMIMILFMRKKINYIPNKFYVLSFLVLSISATLYIIKNLIFNLYPSTQFNILSIHLDWLITIPMLLAMLSLIGMYYDHKNKKLMIRIIIIYAIMVISILIADFSVGTSTYIWSLISFIFFIINLWLIWGPVENIASLQGCYAYRLYKLLALCTTLIWIIYPVLWSIGPKNLNIVSHEYYIYLCTMISTVYKLLFIFIALNGIKNLNKTNLA